MTKDRYKLNLFYSGKASEIPYAVFQERTPAVDKVKLDVGDFLVATG